MTMSARSLRVIAIAAAMLAFVPFAQAARKPHVVFLAAPKHVPYSKVGDPAGAAVGERTLKVRALVVDDQVKDWTTGEAHDVTDRSFVVRRALRLNDALPGDRAAAAKEHWVWQRGPWLMVERVTGHVTALKLPDYDPGVSHVSWFRDYAAYCGLTANGKNLYAVVAQLAARKPVLSKKLAAFDPANPPACSAPEWQRVPLRVTFHPSGSDVASFDFVAGSAVLVEDSEDEPETQPAKQN